MDGMDRQARSHIQSATRGNDRSPELELRRTPRANGVPDYVRFKTGQPLSPGLARAHIALS